MKKMLPPLLVPANSVVEVIGWFVWTGRANAQES